jgi:hypothetical protein
VIIFFSVVFYQSISNGSENVGDDNENIQIQEINILTEQSKNADLKPNNDHGTRSYTRMENDIHGGSWVDSFEDDAGVDWGMSDNLRLVEGDVLIKGSNTIDPNTIALWHFDEGFGSIAYDSTSNKNDGNINNASWTTGKYNKALSFDGSWDYVTLPSGGDGDPFHDNFEEYSIIAWFNPQAVTSRQVVYEEGGDYDGINMYIYQGALYGGAWSAANSFSGSWISTHITTGWHHGAVVYSVQNQYFRLYLDGTLKNSIVDGGEIAVHDEQASIGGQWYDSKFETGRDPANFDNYFNGIIDEVAVYDRALSAQEIKDLYLYGQFRYQPRGNLTSKSISLPNDMHWDTLIINKSHPENTFINITILNASDNQPISVVPTYLKEGEFDISNIDPVKYPSIKLNATFEGDCKKTPTLHFWAVSFNRSNTWQDTLFGGEKVETADNVEAVDGNAQLANRIDPNALALWHFDEGSGTIAYDATTNDNDGTLGGDGVGTDIPTWTASKFITALNFDGSDDYVSVPSGVFGPFNFRSAVFSIELWFKTTASGTMIFAGTYHTLSSNHDFWEIGLSNGKAIFKFRTYSDSNNEVYIESPLPYNDGKWNHIAAVKYEGKKGRLYINGNFVGDDTTSGTYSSVDTDTALYFGSNYLGTKFFNGIIDEIAIYNRSLSAQEIKDHFENYSYIYASKGNLISKSIQLPMNMWWDTLIINETKPLDTSLNVTILDATSNQPISSFISLTDTEIDISSINPIIHDSIKLQAAFETNGLDTSILHDWSVNWTENTAPRFIDIKSPSVINRTKSAQICINVSDKEESEDNLTVKVKYKSSSDSEWPTKWKTIPNYSTDHWNYIFMTHRFSDVGLYSFKVSVNDSFQYLNITTHLDLIEVINNKPTQPDVYIYPVSPKTIDVLTVLAENSTDIDYGGEQLERPDYWYRWYKNGSHLSNFDNKTNIPHTETQKDDSWRCMVYPADDYDVGIPGEAEVIILNSPPEIAESFTSYQMYEDNVEVLGNKLVSMFNDPDNDILIFSASGQDYIKVEIIQDNGTVKLSPEPNWFGTEYITFYANDSSPIEAEQTVEVTVHPTNDLPKIVQIGNQIVSEDSSGLGFVVEQNDELHLRIVVEDIDGDVERGMIQYIFNKTESNTFYFQNSEYKLIFQPNSPITTRHHQYLSPNIFGSKC